MNSLTIINIGHLFLMASFNLVMVGYFRRCEAYMTTWMMVKGIIDIALMLLHAIFVAQNGKIKF